MRIPSKEELSNYYTRYLFGSSLFKSEKEYIGYMQCLARARVGDEVDAYLTFPDGYCANNPTLYTGNFTIIAMYSEYMVIGRKDNGNGFWRKNNEQQFMRMMTEHIPNIDEYQYGWSVARTSFSGARISKLYRKNGCYK